ncbi:hypothetical protein V1527DRAFT_451012 [Lipomyces starkeyi]
MACLDNADTNIRFNEIYLGLFVMAGDAADQFGTIRRSLQLRTSRSWPARTSRLPREGVPAGGFDGVEVHEEVGVGGG